MGALAPSPLWGRGQQSLLVKGRSDLYKGSTPPGRGVQHTRASSIPYPPPLPRQLCPRADLVVHARQWQRKRAPLSMAIRGGLERGRAGAQAPPARLLLLRRGSKQAPPGGTDATWSSSCKRGRQQRRVAGRSGARPGRPSPPSPARLGPGPAPAPATHSPAATPALAAACKQTRAKRRRLGY